MGIEPTTRSLGSYCSTTELHPHSKDSKHTAATSSAEFPRNLFGVRSPRATRHTHHALLSGAPPRLDTATLTRGHGDQSDQPFAAHRNDLVKPTPSFWGRALACCSGDRALLLRVSCHLLAMSILAEPTPAAAGSDFPMNALTRRPRPTLRRRKAALPSPRMGGCSPNAAPARSSSRRARRLPRSSTSYCKRSTAATHHHDELGGRTLPSGRSSPDARRSGASFTPPPTATSMVSSSGSRRRSPDGASAW